MMDWYNHGGMSTGGWIAMIAIMIGFWGFVIFVVVMFFRGDGRAFKGGSSLDRAPYRDPVETLQQRFARGELDSDEYEASMALLRGSGR
jgi:putative membrane protein